MHNTFKTARDKCDVTARQVGKGQVHNYVFAKIKTRYRLAVKMPVNITGQNETG